MNQQKSHQTISQVGDDTLLLAEIFDHIPSGLILVDQIGRIFRANPAALALLGEPLLGETWLSVIQRCFCIKADDGHEVSLRNGKRVQVSTLPLQKQPGQLVQITDLTETRRLQEQVSHMQRLSALGKMAATLAHQIRTPLSAAMLYGANLANRTLKTESRQLFQQKLMARLQELERQVRDVLLFAKNGEQQKVEPTTVGDLLGSLQLRTESMLHSANANLTVEGLECTDSLLVNQEALLSALANLLENALQAGATHLLMTANATPQHAVIQVVDNGNGIPAEHKNRIFEPFYTTRSNGTGLGLAVVQAVIQAHQGSIQVSSVVGEGTCFTVSLPLYVNMQTEENVA